MFVFSCEQKNPSFAVYANQPRLQSLTPAQRFIRSTY